MKPAKFNLILAFVLIGLSSVVTAQTSSSLDFKVFGGEGGLFPILANGSGNAVEYALADGSVDFMVDPGLSYDNPLFCFDFSDAASAAVTLNATDASGHVVMNSVGLASDLSYNLPGTNQADVISYSPQSSVQCFFQDLTAESPNFGLFGKLADNQEPRTVDEGSLFSDAFAAFPELDIQYQKLQINSGESQTVDGADVSPGDKIAYDVVISNTGNATADRLAFQEVFPASAAHVAFLTDGTWACQDNTELDDLCSAAGLTEGTGPLRFENLELPPGGEVTFTIFRTVQVDSSTGQILLHSGAVDGPGKIAKNAVAQATLNVL